MPERADPPPPSHTLEGSTAQEPELREIPEIDRLMAAALAEHRLPGAVIVVGRGDGVYFRKAYGQRALIPAPLPMTEDTIFDQASLTKPIVTATLIQYLVSRGRLDLDDPVSTHLPEFGSQGKQAVTVRQLLLHTGGLPIVNPLSDYADGPERALAKVFSQRLEAAPGTRYIYGDLGYIVLGVLIERLSGEPLDRLARRPCARQHCAGRCAHAVPRTGSRERGAFCDGNSQSRPVRRHGPVRRSARARTPAIAR